MGVFAYHKYKGGMLWLFTVLLCHLKQHPRTFAMTGGEKMALCSN
jgi:hypothetical protein